MQRLIAVILPVYNGMPYLEQSVGSVLQQTFQDFEFLILDDCSTDGSWEYLSQLKDPRVKLLRNPVNKGLFPNLNKLAGFTESPLVKLWSQDDIMYPDALKTIVDFHARWPQVGFSYSTRDYIDEKGRLLPSDQIDHTPEIVSPELHARIAFFVGSIAGNIANVTLSRTALEQVGPFREDMRISGDFDMWVRLARHHPVGFIRQPLVQLRDHAGQLSRQEKYYIYHLQEDVLVYNYLLGYVSPEIRKEGRSMLRRYKLIFYYTLMLKAFFKGRVSTGYAFLRALARFDNIFMVTLAFIKKRVFKYGQDTFSYQNNKDLVSGNV